MEKKKKRTIRFRVKCAGRGTTKRVKKREKRTKNRRENQGYHAQGKARMGKDKGKRKHYM